jgi:hypothetical protein
MVRVWFIASPARDPHLLKPHASVGAPYLLHGNDSVLLANLIHITHQVFPPLLKSPLPFAVGTISFHKAQKVALEFRECALYDSNVTFAPCGVISFQQLSRYGRSKISTYPSCGESGDPLLHGLSASVKSASVKSLPVAVTTHSAVLPAQARSMSREYTLSHNRYTTQNVDGLVALNLSHWHITAVRYGLPLRMK